MDQIYITDIKIDHVRHLKNIEIPLSENHMKHLIITGKNGSGKTSLLDALARYIYLITRPDYFNEQTIECENLYPADVGFGKNNLYKIEQRSKDEKGTSKRLLVYEKEISLQKTGVVIQFNELAENTSSLFSQGKFVTAYYKADRIFKAQIPQHVEKAEQIAAWFKNFDDLLKRIFDDDSVELVFDEETFQFTIHMNDRDSFDFNTLSSGYAAVLDIVVDLIIRMESQSDRKFDFSVAGIVLIDEIETHLHLELQRKILDLLTSIFPNIQFILSTHSPFIINSVDNAVIYDLEKNLLVENGLSDVPYAGIVEGYFNSNEMSMLLQKKFNRYKELVNKEKLTDEDYDEISELEMYLNEIPDYLALNITTEYQRLKEVLRSREDI